MNQHYCKYSTYFHEIDVFPLLKKAEKVQLNHRPTNPIIQIDYLRI